MVIVDGKLITWNEFASKLGYPSYKCCGQFEFVQNFITDELFCTKCRSKVVPIIADHLTGKRFINDF